MIAGVPGRTRRPSRRPVQPGSGRTGRAGSDRGAVTVEAALALCSLTVFLVVAIGAIAAVAAGVRCTDAARELARLAARGEPERGRGVASQLAPDHARMELTRDGDTFVARVSVDLLAPLPVRVGGRAVAAAEPGVP